MTVARRRRLVDPRIGSAPATKQRAHRPDYILIMLVGLIMLFGLVIIYAIGPQRSQVLNSIAGTSFSETYFVIKQAVSLGLALTALFVMAVLPLSFIKQYAGKLLLFGLIACGALFLFGNVLGVEQIARCSLGACRWFELGPIGSFQPSELLKFGILIFLARFLADRMKKGQVNDWNETIIPVLVLSAAALFMVVFLQKDLGTGVSMVAIISSLLVIAGVNWRIGGALLGGLAVLGMLAIVSAPHRIERVATFLQGDETSVASGEGAADTYHIHHAKIAIGSGGLLGVGIGNSVQATGYLPEAINDSVFAIIGETFGFLGLMVLLILMTTLLMRILRITERLQDEWMQLVAAGLFGWLTAHIVLNVASMTGVFPLTGITLPLLSFGGTSMIFIAAALGMVFQASRYTTHSLNKRKDAYANLSRGRGIGRTRHAGRRRTA